MKKIKKSDDKKSNSNTYNYLLKDKTGKTDEINIKHKSESLKVKLKNDNKGNGDNDDVVFLDKNLLLPHDRL